MQLNSVVFPAPLGPTSPTASPGITERDTSLSAAMPPNRIEIPEAWSNGSATRAPRRGYRHGRGYVEAPGARLQGPAVGRGARPVRLAIVVGAQESAHPR